MLKKCFGIISWFPDNEPNRSQRIERLNKAFKQLQDVFGNDIEFLIVAQNWKDYKLPESIKNVTIFKYNKLGILGARKMLRKHFLEYLHLQEKPLKEEIAIEKKNTMFKILV